MYFAFWLLILAFPFFFIYGVYKAIVPYTKKDEQKIIQKFFDHLLHSDIKLTEKEKDSVDTVAQLMTRTHLWEKHSSTTQVQPIAKSESTAKLPETQEVFSPKAPTFDATSALHSLDNINMLLYVGAFLLIVASSLFATYSYAFLGPATKIFLLFIFSSVFYVGGIALYTQTLKVKPAGLVFTGIGLLTQPLIGLAIYNFIFLAGQGYLIWFVTSAACFVSYLIAYWLMRKQFLAYLITFSLLSTLISLLLFQAMPAYFIGYTVCVISMVYLVCSKQKQLPKDVSQALNVTSFITIPLTLISSLSFIETYVIYFYTAATFVLSALYYFMNYVVQPKESLQRVQYLAVSAFLFPISVMIMTLDKHVDFFSVEMAVVVAIVSLLYTLVMEVAIFFQKTEESDLFAIFAGLLSVISIVQVFEKVQVCIFFALFATILNAYLTHRRKNIYTHGFGIAGYLTIPVAFSRYVGFELFSVYTGLLYSLTTTLLYSKRYLYKERKEFAEISLLSIVISFSVSLLFSQAEFAYVVLLSYFLQCAFLFFVSYLEDNPNVLGLAAAILYLGVFRLCDFWRLDVELFSLGFALVGVVLYFAARLLEERRRQVLIIAGIVGLFGSALYDFSLETRALIPQIALVTTGLLVVYESTKQKFFVGERLGLATMLAAFQWMIYAHLFVHESHVFALMWTGYFAYLAYSEKGESRQSFTALALSCATLPIGYRGLSSEVHGLFLLFQSLPMLFLGILLKDKLIKYWSVAVLIIEVLYYMRKFLLDLPGWAIFGILGVSVLFTGVYLLTRRKEEL